MGVFPAASRHTLPAPCQHLMTDPHSPIIDFYPERFEFDPNGKAMSWLWVALLPFVDEKRLVAAVSTILSSRFSSASSAAARWR